MTEFCVKRHNAQIQPQASSSLTSCCDELPPAYNDIEEDHTMQLSSGEKAGYFTYSPTTTSISIQSLTEDKIISRKKNVKVMAISPDGNHVAINSGDHQVRLWDLESCQVILGPLAGRRYGDTPIAFSPDSTQVAISTDNCNFQVWDIKASELLIEPIPKPKTASPRNIVSCLQFSADGSRIASGTHDGAICIWDVVSGVALFGPFKDCSSNKGIRSLAFSPDNQQIASGSANKTVMIWDISSKLASPVVGPLKGPKKSPRLLAFSSDGRSVICGCTDRRFYVWEVTTGAPSSPSTNPNTALLSRLSSTDGRKIAVSPDGRWIATGTYSYNIFKGNDLCVRIWDSQTGAFVIASQSKISWCHSVSFSGDGKQVVAGYNGRAVIYTLGLSHVVKE